jgi:hypothetical protein
MSEDEDDPIARDGGASRAQAGQVAPPQGRGRLRQIWAERRQGRAGVRHRAGRLTADAAEIEDYLRGAVRAMTWSKSAGSVKRAQAQSRTAKPVAETQAQAALQGEGRESAREAARGEARRGVHRAAGPPRHPCRAHRLARAGDARGRADGAGEDEWVLLLEGAAGLRIEDSARCTLGRAIMSGSRAGKALGDMDRKGPPECLAGGASRRGAA